MNTKNDLEGLDMMANEEESNSIEQIKGPESSHAEEAKENAPSDSTSAVRNQAPSTLKAALFAAAITVIIGAGTYWYTTIQIPINEATAEFNEAAKDLEARNAELDKALSLIHI